MPFKVMELPYTTDALEPFLSKETLEFHYGKHYKNYVATLNKLTKGSRLEQMALEAVILENAHQDNAIFHNAAQAWNHEFLWKSMSPEKNKPTSTILSILQSQVGSRREFEDRFLAAATDLFGSGWVWVVKESDGSVSIEALSNAGSPITRGKVPLLVCDVWEHAYYLDYQNDRFQYLKNFLQVLDWNFLELNYTSGNRFMVNRFRESFQKSQYI